MPRKQTAAEKQFIKDLKTLSPVDCAGKHKISVSTVKRERDRRNIPGPVVTSRYQAEHRKAMRDKQPVSKDIDKLVDRFLTDGSADIYHARFQKRK